MSWNKTITIRLIDQPYIFPAKTKQYAPALVCVSQNSNSTKTKVDAARSRGFPAECHLLLLCLEPKCEHTTSCLPSKQNKVTDGELRVPLTPPQFFALCRLKNPFHLRFIPPPSSAHMSCHPIMQRCRDAGAFTEKSSCDVSCSSIAQQISTKTPGLFSAAWWKFYGLLWHFMLI